MSTQVYKKCPKCGKEKPKTEFFKDWRRKDGLYSYCKPCHNAVTYDYKRRNREFATQIERNRYHRIQEEAGCHLKLRNFYPGYRLIRDLLVAEVVEI